MRNFIPILLAASASAADASYDMTLREARALERWAVGFVPSTNDVSMYGLQTRIARAFEFLSTNNSLNIGSMGWQDSNRVDITGGTILGLSDLNSSNLTISGLSSGLLQLGDSSGEKFFSIAPAWTLGTNLTFVSPPSPAQGFLYSVVNNETNCALEFLDDVARANNPMVLAQKSLDGTTVYIQSSLPAFVDTNYVVDMSAAQNRLLTCNSDVSFWYATNNASGKVANIYIDANGANRKLEIPDAWFRDSVDSVVSNRSIGVLRLYGFGDLNDNIIASYSVMRQYRIFADAFNRADSSAVGGLWSSENDPSSLLSVASCKLRKQLGGSGSVGKVLGTTSKELWIEFTFTPSQVTGLGYWYIEEVCAVLSPLSRYIAAILIIQANAAGEARRHFLRSYDDDNDYQDTTTYDETLVAGQTYTYKMHIISETGEGTGDGALELYVDDVLRISATGLYFVADSMQVVHFGSYYESWTGTGHNDMDDLWVDGIDH